MQRQTKLVAGWIERRSNTVVLVALGLAGVFLLLNAFPASVDDAGPDGETYLRLGQRAADASSPFACGNFNRAYWSPGWVTMIAIINKLGGGPTEVRVFLILAALAVSWMTSGIAMRLSGPLAAATKIAAVGLPLHSRFDAGKPTACESSSA